MIGLLLGPSLGIRVIPSSSRCGESLFQKNLGATKPPKIESEGCDGRDEFYHDTIIVLLALVLSFFVENFNPVFDEFTLEKMAPSHRFLVIKQCLVHGRVVTWCTGGVLNPKHLMQ